VTGPDTFTSIQAAIDAAYTVVYVLPGVYEEQVRYTRSVQVIAVDGPLLTVISGGPTRFTPVVFPQPVADPIVGLLRGFSVVGGEYGVFVSSRANATIQNCIVENHQLNGVYATWDNVNPVTQLQVVNCVIRENLGDGVRLAFPGNQSTAFTSSIFNTIITDNNGFGLNATGTNGVTTSSESRFSYSHNNSFGNSSGIFGTNAANGELPIGPGNLTLAPQFVNSASGPGSDVRLLPTSPLRDAGWDGLNALLRDPDGTRNDMGAYGGPHAAGYFGSPEDGPVVREVLAPANINVDDGPFTITARGTVR